MPTAQDIIESAFRALGVQSPTTDQLDDALVTLNEMLDGWSAERLMVPFRTEENFALTKGTAVYTIGSGGAFNTDRPIKIEKAYVRDSSNNDYAVEVTMDLDQYNRVTDKSVEGRPERLYYAPEFPLGKIHLDPNPDAAHTLHLFSWKRLTSFAALSTSLNMPGEYVKAMRLSLAVDLAPELSVQLHGSIVQQAIGAHLTIRNLNKPAVGAARHDVAIAADLRR
ncbi:MAG: hypothetical protein ACE5JS_21320, partial [Nitrospinota bacterium]